MQIPEFLQETPKNPHFEEPEFPSHFPPQDDPYDGTEAWRTEGCGF